MTRTSFPAVLVAAALASAAAMSSPATGRSRLIARQVAAAAAAPCMSDRQFGAPDNPWVSKSPQQQAYEQAMRQQQQGQGGPDARTQMFRSRQSTGGSQDGVLQANWFQKAKGSVIYVVAAGAAGFAGWQGNKMFKGRQADLIDAFAESAVYCGDIKAQLAATVTDFKKQLGPGPYKERMLARFVAALATNRPVGAKSIRALQATQAELKVPDSAMDSVFEQAASEHLADRPSVLGKLVFLAERTHPGPAATALRERLPYGAEYVESLQQMLLEKTFREAVVASGQDLASASVPSDIAELRMSQAEAQALLDSFRREELEVARKAAMESEEAAEEERLRKELLAKVNKEAPPPRAESDAPPMPASSAGPAPGGADADAGHECSKCGYTIFPAAGREWKFFGEDFKCPQCGAPKSDFKPATD